MRWYLPSFLYFYPRSPCGERLWHCLCNAVFLPISIHALLAESDRTKSALKHVIRISIHALLAESDNHAALQYQTRYGISIHALLAESDQSRVRVCQAVIQFLSTLSLRRATNAKSIIWKFALYFYPRSPCGERHDQCIKDILLYCISIHALLAESDIHTCQYFFKIFEFLSTLSLRRATPSFRVLWC